MVVDRCVASTWPLAISNVHSVCGVTSVSSQMCDNQVYGRVDHENASSGFLPSLCKSVINRTVVLDDFLAAVNTCDVRVDVDRLVQSFACENRTRG